MSYSISPVSQSTRLLSKPGKAKRKIPKIPFKVRGGLTGGSDERPRVLAYQSDSGVRTIFVGHSSSACCT